MEPAQAGGFSKKALLQGHRKGHAMASDSNGVGTDAGPDIQNVRQDMEALRRDFTKLVSDVRAATAGRAEKLYEDLHDDAPEAVRERVRERPITSLAVAFIAGALFAAVLRR